jgi:hypothetical protein
MLPKMDDYCLFDRSNGTNPFFFLLCDGHGSPSRSCFWNIPWSPIGFGLVVLEFPMARPCGRSRTVHSRIGHSRLRVRRKRQIQPGVKFVPAYL